MNCFRCNKEIVGRIKRLSLRFCSRYCQETEWKNSHKEQFEKTKFEYYDRHDFGNMKRIVLQRDKYSCVKCGITDEQHLVIFERHITVDHINGNRNNNSLNNLQTLCLSCHGKKDTIRGKKFRDLSFQKQQVILKNLLGWRYKNVSKTL